MALKSMGADFIKFSFFSILVYFREKNNHFLAFFWTSAPKRDGHIESVPLGRWLVGYLHTWKTALTIFLLFCRKLGHHKGSKLTEPDFEKKILFG